ncbi:MAG: hypothetical protein ACYC2X_10645 [Coriobacteriia bacterium]
MEIKLRLDGPIIAPAYVADISLIAAILEAQNGDMSALPPLLLAPELRAVVASLSKAGEASSSAIHLLVDGAGRQERTVSALVFDPARARHLLSMLPKDDQNGDSMREETPVPLASLPKIRMSTRRLAEESGMPVISLGAGFKRFLKDLPALIYKDSVGTLEWVRRQVRGNTGSDTRCLWVTTFMWVIGNVTNIEGLPPQDEIALMIDP